MILALAFPERHPLPAAPVALTTSPQPSIPNQLICPRFSLTFAVRFALPAAAALACHKSQRILTNVYPQRRNGASKHPNN